jgi:hypothetical protein
MESSKITKQEVISLGKAIISELGMEIECNTPARWLVHYIAENINKSENSEGEEKNTAERKCLEAIFKLWHHRSELPRGINPFTEFDSIFRGLARLDNTSRSAYYSEFSQFEIDIDKDESKESKQWVDIAKTIDNASKELVSESFKSAAEAALSEKAKNILKLAPEDSGDDIRIMFNYLNNEDDESKLKALNLKNIELKIERAQKLRSICDLFIEKYQNQLTNDK